MSLIYALNIIFASSTVFDVLRTTEKYDKIRCFPLIQIAKNNFEFYLGNISSIMAAIVRGFRKLFHHVIKRKTFSGNIFCYHSFEPYKRKIFSNLLPLEYHRRSLVEVR